MEIMWKPEDDAVKQVYDKNKAHFMQNSDLKKPLGVDSDVAFIASTLAAYHTIWMK